MVTDCYQFIAELTGADYPTLPVVVDKLEWQVSLLPYGCRQLRLTIRSFFCNRG